MEATPSIATTPEIIESPAAAAASRKPALSSAVPVAIPVPVTPSINLLLTASVVPIVPATIPTKAGENPLSAHSITPSSVEKKRRMNAVHWGPVAK